MKRGWMTLSVAALSAALTVAQDPGRGGGRGFGGFNRARLAGPLVAAAADTNRDHEVSAEEWTAFRAAIKGAAGDAVDLDAVKAAILMPMLDRDADQKFTSADLDKVFANLDRDGDGAIGEDEMRRPRRRGFGRRGQGGRRGDGERGGRPDMKKLLEKYDANGNGRLDPEEREKARAEMGRSRGGERGDRGQRGPGGRRGGNRWHGMVDRSIARAADKDSSGDVTKEEWTTFAASLTKSDQGVIDHKAFTKKIASSAKTPGADEGGGRRGFMRRGSFLGMIDRFLDANNDETIDGSDFDEIFTALDANKDGKLDKEEAAPRRRGGRGRGRGRGEGDGGRDI